MFNGLNRETRLFKSLNNQSKLIYASLCKQNIDKYMTGVWEDYNSGLEALLLPLIPIDFLSKRDIAGSMFVNAGGAWLEEQVTYLEKHIQATQLKRILRESRPGFPAIINTKYKTSHNSIHHLYHLIRYEAECKESLLRDIMVVEWGGGYGNLAKLYTRLNPYIFTYVIIDTPLFITLQHAYLGSVLGQESINLITKRSDKIINGKVNLLPVGLLEQYNLNADAFISTWALSESSKYAQDYVAKKKFFNADQILIAHQDSSNELPAADRVAKLAARQSASSYEMKFLPGNHYVFK